MTTTILIADDDTVLLRTLSIRLRAEGFEIFTVQDSYQALEMARKHRPDVLILDINMPAGEGFSVQDRLMKMDGFEHMPTIYLTGERSDRTTLLAKRPGTAALIHKPFETTDLIKAIKQAVESRGPVGSTPSAGS